MKRENGGKGKSTVKHTGWSFRQDGREGDVSLLSRKVKKCVSLSEKVTSSCEICAACVTNLQVCPLTLAHGGV